MWSLCDREFEIGNIIPPRCLFPIVSLVFWIGGGADLPDYGQLDCQSCLLSIFFFQCGEGVSRAERPDSFVENLPARDLSSFVKPATNIHVRLISDAAKDFHPGI